MPNQGSKSKQTGRIVADDLSSSCNWHVASLASKSVATIT